MNDEIEGEEEKEDLERCGEIFFGEGGGRRGRLIDISGWRIAVLREGGGFLLGGMQSDIRSIFVSLWSL